MGSCTLTLDDLPVAVEIGGANRQAKLTIDADGGLHLLAASNVAVEDLQDFLASKRKWIYTKLAKKEELRHVAVYRELVDGETFQYLGRNYRLQVGGGISHRVRLLGGRLQVPAELAEANQESPIIDWYRSSGRTWVAPRVMEWAERIRVVPAKLDVTGLGRKWGSATKAGCVRIHWATFQLSPVLIDYVVAHELAHLQEPHHGSAFWDVLGRAMPDYAERKDKLAHVGAGLWFGNIRPRP